MVLSSFQMSVVGGLFVLTSTASAAGDKCGVRMSVALQSPISFVSCVLELASVMRTSAVDKG